MRTRKRYFLNYFYIVIFITLVTGKGLCQTEIFLEKSKPYTDLNYRNNIKTIKLGLKNIKLSYPVIELNSQRQLQCSFDELGDEFTDYAYTVVHCNQHWQVSDITQFDYIEGFFYQTINNYSLSINTTQDYIHYSFTFPNSDFKLLLSGNYALIVFEEDNPEHIVFTRRFMVSEPLLSIHTTFRRPDDAIYFDAGQEIDLSIEPAEGLFIDPYTNLEIQLLQNYNWFTKKTFRQPRVVNVTGWLYNFTDNNIFYGGKEYRFFDTRSLRFNKQGVRQIEFVHPYYFVDLHTDQLRNFKPYMYNEDFNGRNVIEVQEYDDDQLTSEYVIVTFRLAMEMYENEADLYVWGELSNWELSEEYKMTYDFDLHEYMLETPLKQGFYNYTYVYVPKNKQLSPDFTYLEGSGYETENDYIILCYFTDPAERYTRLVGHSFFNTLQPN